MMVNQFHTPPILITYFTKIHLNVILPFPSQSSILQKLYIHFLPSTIWATCQTQLNPHIFNNLTIPGDLYVNH